MEEDRSDFKKHCLLASGKYRVQTDVSVVISKDGMQAIVLQLLHVHNSQVLQSSKCSRTAPVAILPHSGSKLRVI